MGYFLLLLAFEIFFSWMTIAFWGELGGYRILLVLIDAFFLFASIWGFNQTIGFDFLKRKKNDSSNISKKEHDKSYHITDENGTTWFITENDSNTEVNNEFSLILDDGKTIKSNIDKKDFQFDIVAKNLFDASVDQMEKIKKEMLKNNAVFDDKKFVISSFAYLYVFWLFNYNEITAGQAADVEEMYVSKFKEYNRICFKTSSFENVMGNEILFEIELKEVDRKIRKSFHANNHTLDYEKIVTDYLLELFNEGNDLEETAQKTCIEYFKEWALKSKSVR